MLENQNLTPLDKFEKLVDVVNSLPEILEIIKQTGMDISDIKKELQEILTLKTELQECKAAFENLEKRVKELEFEADYSLV